MRKKKVAVLMVGVNRSLPFALPSINREIINPIRSAKNLELQTFAYFIAPRGHHINNPRSSESGFIGKSLPEALSQWNHVHTSAETLLEEAPRRTSFFNLPWHYDLKTVSNLYQYLSALETCFERFIQDGGFHAVILCRPDLVVFPGLRIVEKLKLMNFLSLISRRVAIVPHWQNWGGVNDRFAILSHDAAKGYLTRIRLAAELDSDGDLLNSELLAKEGLSGAIIQNSIRTPMVRVRLGNRFEKTDLDYFYTEFDTSSYPIDGG